MAHEIVETWNAASFPPKSEESVEKRAREKTAERGENKQLCCALSPLKEVVSRIPVEQYCVGVARRANGTRKKKMVTKKASPVTQSIKDNLQAKGH